MSPSQRIDAKRVNEQLKLSATFANTLGAGSLVAGGVVPLATNKPPTAVAWFFLVLGAVLCHAVSHLIILSIVPED